MNDQEQTFPEHQSMSDNQLRSGLNESESALNKKAAKGLMWVGVTAAAVLAGSAAAIVATVSAPGLVPAVMIVTALALNKFWNKLSDAGEHLENTYLETKSFYDTLDERRASGVSAIDPAAPKPSVGSSS